VVYAAGVLGRGRAVELPFTGKLSRNALGTKIAPYFDSWVLMADGETGNRALFNLIGTEFLDFPHRLVHLAGCYCGALCLRGQWQMDEEQHQCEEPDKRARSVGFVHITPTIDAKQRSSCSRLFFRAGVKEESRRESGG
jgi:hypothetical protein